MTVCQSPEVVRAGYLIKSPPDDAPPMSQWRRRWFVLCDSLRAYPLADRFVRLEYYQNESEARRLADPKGIINLNTCTRVSIQKPLKGHKFVFDVCTNERVYHLAAETAYEKQQWITVLNDLLFTENCQQQVRMQAEGNEEREAPLQEGRTRPTARPVPLGGVLVPDRNQQKPSRPVSFAGFKSESQASEQPTFNSPSLAITSLGGLSDAPPVPERKNRHLPRASASSTATTAVSQDKVADSITQKKNSEGSVISTHHGMREPVNHEPLSGSISCSAPTSQNYQILYPTSFSSSNGFSHYETAEFGGNDSADYDLANPLEEEDPQAPYDTAIFPSDEEEEERMYDEAGHVEESEEARAYEVPAQSLQAMGHLSSQQKSKQKSAPSAAMQQYSESNPPVPQPRRRKGIKQEEYSEIEARPLSVDDDDSGDYGHIVRIEPIKESRSDQSEIIPITSSVLPQISDSPVPKPRRHYENIGCTRAPRIEEASYSVVQYN